MRSCTWQLTLATLLVGSILFGIDKPTTGALADGTYFGFIRLPPFKVHDSHPFLQPNSIRSDPSPATPGSAHRPIFASTRPCSGRAVSARAAAFFSFPFFLFWGWRLATSDPTLLGLVPSPSSVMAVARPVRVLGLAAILMWCFFLYQIFAPGSSVKMPSGIPKNERDPLLDREPPSPCKPPSLGCYWLTSSRLRPVQLPVNQKVSCTVPAPTMRPTRRTPPASTPRCWPSSETKNCRACCRLWATSNGLGTTNSTTLGPFSTMSHSRKSSRRRRRP